MMTRKSRSGKSPAALPADGRGRKTRIGAKRTYYGVNVVGQAYRLSSRSDANRLRRAVRHYIARNCRPEKLPAFCTFALERKGWHVKRIVALFISRNL
jgi:hypothetical protein